MNKEATGLGAGIGALAAAGGGGLLYSLMRKANQADILHRTLSKPSVKPEVAAKELDIPITVVPGFPNALFVKHQKLPPIAKRNVGLLASKLRDRNRPEMANAIEATMNMSARPTGGVVVGEGLLNPTILAHEKGHQMDDSFISSLAPSVEKVWNKYKMPILGTSAAILLGETFPEYREEAALTNLGIQALSSIPVLHAEWTASQNAKKIYPNVDEKLLDTTYNSYLLDTIGGRIALPALAHAGQFIGRNW